MRTPHLKQAKRRALSGALRILAFTLTALVLLPLSRLGAETQAPPREGNADRAWENLLFYSSRWLGSDTSLIDSSEFFLAADGAKNPLAEREAFLLALQGDSMQKPEEERISCRFPARTDWVRRFRPDVAIPEVECPNFTNWLAVSQPKGISVIFSSYFVNNPSSMMGHTFLRIRRGSVNNSPLLDQSVNFAATPTHEIPILYNIDGLLGGFPGNFSMLPYYLKVQEYANAESRDLWEYDLGLTPEETLSVLKSLWEVAPQRIDYYFFDENCSAVLLYLIQNARPDLYLSRKLGSWVHPSDTLRYMMEEPGLVKDIVYRPSSRSRYLAQRAILSDAERAISEDLLRDKRLDRSSFLVLSPERQAAVLDATLAFIEFDENLHGSKKAVKHAELYEAILEARAKLAAAPLTKFPTPEEEAPHLGHKGRRLGFGLGLYEEKAELQLEYRPGQHDLLSPAIGYPPELSIQLGKTRLNWQEEGKVRLRSAEFFHIQSFNPSRSGRFPWSWQLQNNFENTQRKRFQLFGSLGQSMELGERDHFAFLFFDTRLKVEKGKFAACPGVSTGMRYSLGKRFVSFTDIGVERCYGAKTGIWKERWSEELRYSLGPQYELFLEARAYTDAKEFTLGAYRYY